MKQKGFLLITLVGVIAILSIVAAITVRMFVNEMEISSNSYLAEQANYIAEAGLERAKHVLLTENPSDYQFRTACQTITGDSDFTNVVFANGRYSINTTLLPSAGFTQLLSDINASQTTIPAVNTAGYATHGRIIIDGEIIEYRNKTWTSFTNATRGVASSTASGHFSATPIGQQECEVTVTAGIPDLTASTSSKRQLAIDNVPGSTVWFSAAPNSGELLFHWNGATMRRDGPSSNVSDQTFRNIFMLSNASGWAVGDNANIVYWNGANWQTVNSPLSSTGTLNQVFCNNERDCWIVGDIINSSATVLHWNGSNWALTNQGIAIVTNLSAIHCIANNNCWAVGESDALYRWNGSDWNLSTVSGIGTTISLNSVYCNASNDCWSVGQNVLGSALILHWNGSAWSRVSAGSIPDINLHAITCNAANDCWTVGDPQGGQTTIAHWNGSVWQRIIGGLPNVALNAITCKRNDDCWAAGNPDADGEVILHWNGSTWTRIGPFSNIPDVAIHGVSMVGSSVGPKFFARENFV